MNESTGNKHARIAFVIVTYNQEFFRCSSYMSLINSLATDNESKNYLIYIYDNSDKHGWEINFVHLKEAEQIRYHHNPNNPGISKAYNEMATKARSEGCDWIILFDQDTTLPLNTVIVYKEAIAKKPELLIKAPILHLQHSIFSPHRTFLGRSKSVESIEPGIYSLEEFRIVNSGLAIHLPLFFEVGGYNERIKLDFADFQFLSRLQKKVSCFQLLNIHCLQDFSHNEPDMGKALKRFSIYITDYRNCERITMTQKMQYALLAFSHMLKLSAKFKSLQFLKIYFA